MRFQLFVFDVAGTTVCDDDNAVAGRLCDALRAAGFEVSEADVDPVMGMPKPLALRQLMTERSPKPPTSQEVRRIHADFQRRIIEHYCHAPNVRAMPGVGELFAELRRRGVTIGLDTGFDRPTLDAIVERLGWTGSFDDSVTSDEVARGRPDPEMIHVLMQRAGVVDPAQVVKVGDSVSDLEQGVAAGCGRVVAILNSRTRPHLERFPGVLGIRSLDELLPTLDAQPTVTA